MSNGLLSIPGRSANSTASKDRAEISVDGQKFDDWETIWVQLHALDPWSSFRFTATERQASAGLFGSSTQFNVGKQCTITIGGVQVINGLIEQRQVAYDANRHHVELQGRSMSSIWARASVYVKDGKLDNKSVQDAVKKVTERYKCQIKTLGSVPEIKFDKLQAFPGEPIWDFAERICRPAGVCVGVDHENNLILAKDYIGRSGSNVIEGQNIKHMQCVFDKTNVFKHYSVWLSHNASDERWGQSITQQIANYDGSYPFDNIIVTPGEQNTKDQQFANDRAQFEARMREMAAVNANVVVYGWFRDESTLWWPWDQVQVQSPMCPLNETMAIRAVTFTQDPSGGTQATLDLCNPLAMGGQHQKGSLTGDEKDPTKADPPQPN